MEKFKIGDVVFCAAFKGSGYVFTNKNLSTFPIVVEFIIGKAYFYSDGKCCVGKSYLRTENEYNCKVRIRSIKLKQ